MSDGDDVLKTSKHHDLRDRIAAALHDAPTNSCATQDDFYLLADAVIRELNIYEESRLGPFGIQRLHRYVTEWTADE